MAFVVDFAVFSDTLLRYKSDKFALPTVLVYIYIVIVSFCPGHVQLHTILYFVLSKLSFGFLSFFAVIMMNLVSLTIVNYSERLVTAKKQWEPKCENR
jgi:hypothetical protein